MTNFLQRTEKAQIADGVIDVRVYEWYYAAESSAYRWQKRTDLTAAGLRVCLAARRKQAAGDQKVIRVYERLLEILERLDESGTVTVGSVWDEALQSITTAELRE